VRKALITDSDQLLSGLGLKRGESPYALADTTAFPLIVTRSYVARMRRGDWNDPLLLQVIPRADETAARRGFVADPVGDGASVVAPGLLHKYAGRALLLATGACAIHCRYCFRRAFPFAKAAPRGRAQRDMWAYVAAQPGVGELVLSGGDPFMLSAASLRRLLAPAARIVHLQTLRFHTRVPVADPQRVSAALAAVLKALGRRFRVVVVVHANCAEELSKDVPAALARLSRTGAMLLNQAVLLRGVNDTVDAQERLSRRLLACGVLPYYLHQLDRAAGTWHFEVSEARGKQIMRALRKRLPGYLVPRYVRERSGACAKVPLE
jgi:EF-P beta-lysylation protein EpmB